MSKIALPKDILINLYYKDKKSLSKISILLNVSYTCILNNFIRYNLPRRTLSEANRISSKCRNKFKITKQFLYRHYIKLHQSCYKISKILGCSAATICLYLIKYDIPTHRLDYPSSFKGKHHTKEVKLILSKKHKGLKYKFSEKTKKRLSKLRSKLFSGSGNGMWQGGLNSQGYFKFTKKLKIFIRKRDNHECKLCHIKEYKLTRLLDVHHIDYCKINCKKDNLISLCNKCNKKVNAYRDYWYAYFTYIMENLIYA